VVGGIDLDPEHPGYKQFRLQPQPGGNLLAAHATYHSLYGVIESAWELKDGCMRLRVHVPPNTQATLCLPKARIEQVTEQTIPLAAGNGIKDIHQEADVVRVHLGAGAYQFEYPY
jgi:alpha-L-rhamnosidase